jgi:hypothetical protein
MNSSSQKSRKSFENLTGNPYFLTISMIQARGPTGQSEFNCLFSDHDEGLKDYLRSIYF